MFCRRSEGIVRITRFKKIKGYRIFNDFVWPDSLMPFGQFNLIYGWNGTGKTTLSNLFRNLQMCFTITEGEVVFEIDGKSSVGNGLNTSTLPSVRVFNREFINASVFASCGEIAPIYFLGQDSVAKQKQIEQIKAEVQLAEISIGESRLEKANADKAIEEFCINKAKIIKELLISSRTTNYNNYDKRRFKQAIESLKVASQNTVLLSVTDKENLRKQKDAQPKEPVSSITVSVPVFSELVEDVESLLKQSVVSQVIQELVDDSEVGVWVQRGLELHSDDRKTNLCRFCGQELTTDRVQALEGHFNDAFSRFQSAIDAMLQNVEQNKDLLSGTQLPDSSRVYEHLANDLKLLVTKANDIIQKATIFLEIMHKALLRKKESPFKTFSLETSQDSQTIPDNKVINQVIANIDAILQKHNAITDEFQSAVEDACQKLEKCYVAEAEQEYEQLCKTAKLAEDTLQVMNDNIQRKKEQITNIEREIVEHLRPAEELNSELQAYLGREELHFEVKETGYSIMRNGLPANDLSEGEKTAIAFLYCTVTVFT